MAETLSASRLQQIPAILKSAFKQKQSMLSFCRLQQLHTVAPTNLESGELFWDRYWSSRMETAFAHAIYLIGRVRSRRLQTYLLTRGLLRTAENLEAFKKDFIEELDDVELTCELKTCPPDTWIRNARFIEHFGSPKFGVWTQALSCETDYWPMLQKTQAMWGHGWYISKSIVNFVVESSATLQPSMVLSLGHASLIIISVVLTT